MKKIILFCMIVLIIPCIQSKAQVRGSISKPNQYKFDAQTLLKRSKTQKIFGWILLATGAGLITSGFVIHNNAIIPDNSWGYDATGLTALPIAFGAVGIMGGGAFLVASGKNKRNAALLLKNEDVNLGSNQQRLTMIGLKIRLNQ
jgi:hypothetical protein